MTAHAIGTFLILAGGFGILYWQLRWLLRAYRTERDRQAPQDRSSRLTLLIVALLVFAGIALATDLYMPRRVAIGGILLLGAIEGLRNWLAR
jgi:uncharacterized membrane protein